MLNHTDHGGIGLPLALLPAFPLDATMWDDVVARLPSTVRAIAVDLPGLGENPVPSTTPDLGVAVTGLEQVLDACAVVSAVVVGISTGGYVAAAMARDVPARVRALGLMSTTTVVGPPDEPDQRRATAEVLERSGTVDAVLSSADEGLGRTAQRDPPELRARVHNDSASAALVGWPGRSPGELAALRPAELVMLQATGHLTLLERPHEVAAALTRFAGRL